MNFMKILMIVIFLVQTICPWMYLSDVQAQELFSPGLMLKTTAPYTPLMLRGMKINPDDPLRMSFIVDRGESGLEFNTEAFGRETRRLVQYFLAALTVPEGEQWVNLSPYEKDRMSSDALVKTVMGQDMLAQDYILKQLTASLVYPEESFGKDFWQEVYARISDTASGEKISTDVFHKVWIVPERGVVYQKGNSVFVVDQHLKVMLDQDYQAMRQTGHNERSPLSDVLRRVLVPRLEQEINTGSHFARLRQIYQAMILAVWYKKNLRDSLLGKVYANHNKTVGVETNDALAKEKIYARYMSAFKKGVFNYIKEEIDPETQEIIPQKYVAGGEVGFREEDLTQADAGQAAQWAGAVDPAGIVMTEAIFSPMAPLTPEDFSMQVEPVLQKEQGYYFLPAAAGQRNNTGTFLSLQQLRAKTDWGIGDIGRSLKSWIDVHAGLGMNILQILPFGPSSAFRSPYGVMSSLMIDHLYVDIEQAASSRGMQDAMRSYINDHQEDISNLNSAAAIDYDRVANLKEDALRVLWQALQTDENKRDQVRLQMQQMLKDEPELEDHIFYFLYKRFQLNQEASSGVHWTKSRLWDWRLWPEAVRDRNAEAIAEVKERFSDELDFLTFVQLVAQEQFKAAVLYGKEKGVQIMVDIPYALDGADIWLHPGVFGLQEENGYKATVKQGVPPEQAYRAGQYWQFFPFDYSNPLSIRFILDRYRFVQKLTTGQRLDHVLGFYRQYYFTTDLDRQMTLQQLGIFDQILQIQQQGKGAADEEKRRLAKEAWGILLQALMQKRGQFPQDWKGNIPEDALTLTLSAQGEMTPNSMIQIVRPMEDSQSAPQESWAQIEYDVEQAVFNGKFRWQAIRVTPDAQADDEGFFFQYLFADDAREVTADDGLRLGYFKQGPGDALMSRFLSLAQEQGSLQIWETLGVVPEAIVQSNQRLGGLGYAPGIWGEVEEFGPGVPNPFHPSHHAVQGFATLSLHDSLPYKVRWEQELSSQAKTSLLDAWFGEGQWSPADLETLTPRVREKALDFFVFSSKSLVAVPNWIDLLGLGAEYRQNSPGVRSGQWTARLPSGVSAEQVLAAMNGEAADAQAQEAVALIRRLMSAGSRHKPFSQPEGTILNVVPVVGSQQIQLRELGDVFEVDAYVAGRPRSVDLLMDAADGQSTTLPMSALRVDPGVSQGGVSEDISAYRIRLRPRVAGKFSFRVRTTLQSGVQVTSEEGFLQAVPRGADLNPLSPGYVLAQLDTEMTGQQFRSGVPVPSEVAEYAWKPEDGQGWIRNVSVAVEATLRGQAQGGLSRISSYLGASTGQESGYYLATDWGGTNLRVVLVHLQSGQDPRIIDKYTVKKAFDRRHIEGGASTEEVFNFMAQQVATLVQKIQDDPEADPEILKSPLKLGAGFSFSTQASASNRARLIHSGIKGWKFPGISIDEQGPSAPDLVRLHQEAIDRQDSLKGKVWVVTIPNDTVALGLAVAGTIALIDGTGANMAVRHPETGEILNLEFGAFSDIPDRLQTVLDKDILENVDPGVHPWEKMVSGKYLIELLRRSIPSEQTSSALREVLENPGIDSRLLSLAVDESLDTSEKNSKLLPAGTVGSVSLDQADWALVQGHARVWLERAGRILGASLSGVLDAIDPRHELLRPVIAYDGSVINVPVVKAAAEDEIRRLTGREVVFRTLPEATAIGTAVSAAVRALDASEVQPGGIDLDAGHMAFESRGETEGVVFYHGAAAVVDSGISGLGVEIGRSVPVSLLDLVR